MSAHPRFRTSLVLRLITATLAAVAIGAYVRAAPVDPVPYTARAILCYVDFTNQQIDELGKGRVITEGSVLVWRIVSDDNSLMNGWEYLEDNTNFNKNYTGKNWGHLEMYPDVAYDGLGDYTGYFEEDYDLKTKDGLVGVYTGTGTLGGVTATYEGVPGTPEACPEEPALPAALCDTVYKCSSVAGTPLEGFVWTFGGVIEGY